MSDLHEIYAIRYARHERKNSDNFIGGDPHDELAEVSYYVWLIRGPHGNFVVDTGFDQKSGEARHRRITKPVGEGLTALGISPDKIDRAILTHMHWDHSGNTDLFPNARYHVQDCEMAYATGRCMCHAMMRVPFGVNDVTALVRKVYAGRVEFHDGSEQIVPGITVHMIGGHSKGLQCVRVETQRGPVVVASDGFHLYRHMDEGRVFPITYSVGDTLEGYKTIQKLAGARSRCIPGHDPRVMEIYPAAKPGLEGWIARLDVEEPKQAG